MDVIKFENIQSKIIEIREQKVLLDFDVAEIYGVETKRINEAVKNNSDKLYVSYKRGGVKCFAVENFDHKIVKNQSCTQSFYREGPVYDCNPIEE
jgi:hypothetical protein